MLYNESFDPEKATKQEMRNLGEHLEEFMEFRDEIVIIPDELIDECGGRTKESLKRINKLIQKFKKGDKSIFDYDDE